MDWNSRPDVKDHIISTRSAKMVNALHVHGPKPVLNTSLGVPLCDGSKNSKSTPL